MDPPGADRARRLRPRLSAVDTRGTKQPQRNRRARSAGEAGAGETHRPEGVGGAEIRLKRLSSTEANGRIHRKYRGKTAEGIAEKLKRPL